MMSSGEDISRTTCHRTKFKLKPEPCNPTPSQNLSRHPARGSSSIAPRPSANLESPKEPNNLHGPTYRTDTMKLLTLNFLTCAIKTCKTQASSFPLHPKDSELEILEADLNLPFLKNILPRLMWEELRVICKEVFLPPTHPPLHQIHQTNTHQLGLPDLPATAPTPNDLVEGGIQEVAEGAQAPDEQPSQTAKDLHRVLLETCIQEGKLVCGCCGHEYAVKEGVANFLLPGHLV